MTTWIAVTAPGSDIGQAITRHLLDRGYGVIGLGRSSSLRFLEELGSDRVHAIACEYTQEQSMVAAFEEAAGRVDRIAGLVHLVGGSLLSRPLLDLELKDLRQVMAVNLDSAFLAGREAVRWMRRTGGGNVVLFGSTTGDEPSAGKLAYGVAKAAVHNLTKSLAQEAAAFGVMANTVAPGYVMTPRHERELDARAARKGVSREELEDLLRSKNVSGRIVRTAELLDVVELLLTTTAIQGQVIPVDLGQVGF
ncbi:MAG TPA: SDR family oxidoreductase [Pseudodesulfovibrio sp.]|nr:SDR family oxidoreductase [Pseudodesulfovibrio sp.]